MAIHGKDATFSIDSSGGSLQLIAPYLTSVGLSRQNDTHDTTTLGDDAHEFIAGLTNGTISLDGFWDNTATVGSATVLDGLIGLGSTTVSWEYGPQGSTNGNVKYSGEGVLQNVDYTSPVADLVTFTATIQISGAVTVGTYAS